MKYAIVHEDPVAKTIASLVLDELERFDVRAEIVQHSAIEDGLRSFFVKFQPNLVFIIGSNKSARIAKLLSSEKLKVCFLYLPAFNLQEPRSAVLKASFFHADVPALSRNSDFEVKGSLLFEYIRKNRRSSEEINGKPLVGVIQKGALNENWQYQMVQKLSAIMPEVNFNQISIDVDLDAAILQSAKSNVVIVTDLLSGMLAVGTNSPALHVYKNTFFRCNREVPPVNNALGEKLLSSITWKKVNEIKEELERLLYNHQCSAEILHGYQKFKSMIGDSNVSRPIVQKVIERLDEY